MGKLRSGYSRSYIKANCIILIFAIVLITMYIYWRPEYTDHEELLYLQQKDGINEMHIMRGQEAFDGEKIVHLDLKGAPPKISYYEQFFRLLSRFGATGILMEYEDMFPYQGILLNATALNAYTIKDIQTINLLAAKNNLKIIPLIQTFGHLEFILKLADYKDYREEVRYPQAICPTYDKSIVLIEEMIKQVVDAHPQSEIIHIGADEVYHIGSCNRCKDHMQKFNFSKNQLYLEHVKDVVKVAKKVNPKLRVLMWDDQFRVFSLEELKSINADLKVEPVVWKYTKEVYDELSSELLEEYSSVFSKLWAASAFKGATGSNEFVCQVTHYLQNNRGWLSIVNEHKDKMKFEGIIITGWQRYDHFAVLCELLPVGIPTLAMVLRLFLGYNDSTLSAPTEVAKLLQCAQPYGLIGSAFGTPRCKYTGAAILENVLLLQQLKQEFDALIDSDSRLKGWMNDYNVLHAFSSPTYVEGVVAVVDRISSELDDIQTDIGAALAEVYDEYTVEEWKSTHIEPIRKKIQIIKVAGQKILAKNSWPRRPLGRKDEL